MNPSAPTRGSSLSKQLGLAERMFATPETKRLLAAIEKGLDAVEASLAAELSFTDDLADATSRYLLEAGGKRVRPMLLLLVSQLGDGAVDDVVTAAKAIEITHLASLYHDDVMDHADRRRGVPSAHTVWGNSIAILTGDLLFARASNLMASLGEGAIRLQAETFERLVLGQLHETVGPKEGEDARAHYLQVLADKTGSLIAAAARAGAIFSNAPSEFEQPVVEYGEKIGVAFQLVDDVIDLSTQPQETGKVPGTDIKAGVVTLPLIYLREQAATDTASAALVERIDRGAAAGEGDDPSDFDAAIAELRAHPATERTLADAHRWAREAVEALAPLPQGPIKTALTRFADSIVERSS